MIDIHKETMRSLCKATRTIRGDLKLHPSTLMRWMTKGCRGIVLEGQKIGGRWYTSDEAIDRFLAKLNSGRQRLVSEADEVRNERVEQALKEVFGEN